ncbi:MAG TPA: DUF1801 domain-containing protein [Candidatus Limnocylindrales bacterium]|jgi:uncharacterized protein YdhG (YjbR/CyaY superfamily)
MPDERTGNVSTFTDEEKGAMRERARELKAAKSGADGEQDLLQAIAKMPESDAAMARRLHELISAAAPELAPRTYYGMPAWAKGGKVLCFFQNASKFKARYATFGFNEEALLDDGAMWATSWALTKLTPAEEKQIVALVKKALG